MKGLSIAREVLVYIADENNLYAGLRFVQDTRSESVPKGISLHNIFSPMKGKVENLNDYAELIPTLGNRALRPLEEHPNYDDFNIVGVHVIASIDTHKGTSSVTSRVMCAYEGESEYPIQSFIRLAMDYKTNNSRQTKALEDYFKSSEVNKHFSVKSMDQVNREALEARNNAKKVRPNPLSHAVRSTMFRR